MRNFFRKHRVVRILARILAVIVILIGIVIIFLNCWPAFGGKASKEDKQEYAKRASNYVNGKFQNEGEFSVMTKKEGAVNQTVSEEGATPKEEVPTVQPSYIENPSEKDFTVTWFGHSTLLLQMHGMNILIDPVFSEYSSPIQFGISKRYSTPPLTAKDLPHIDLVLISHDHYDHLDYNTILEIDDKVDSFVVPLGVENHLERFGVDARKIQTMAWWEEVEVKGLTIGCTPAKHYSNRSITDQYATLWASWVLKDENYQVFESGDTGFGEHFQKIHEKYGAFDFVLLDSGQYDVSWADVHMNPEEAYQAAQVLEAKVAMPIHWGAFKLANHPWDDPAERFVKASEQGTIPVVTPKIGQTVVLQEYENAMERWWRSVE